MYDHKTVQTDTGDKFLSVKSLEEYDCANKRTRLLSMSLFSGNMGKGNEVYSESVVGEWQLVKPNNIGETIWKAACKN